MHPPFKYQASYSKHRSPCLFSVGHTCHNLPLFNATLSGAWHPVLAFTIIVIFVLTYIITSHYLLFEYLSGHLQIYPQLGFCSLVLPVMPYHIEIVFLQFQAIIPRLSMFSVTSFKLTGMCWYRTLSIVYIAVRLLWETISQIFSY